MTRRLLFLINSLGPYGAENFVLAHVRHTDRTRFEPHVCQLGGDRTLAPEIEAAGAPVHDLRERRRLDPRALARLFGLLRKLRVDVLQTHVGYAGIVGRLVGRAARVPLIVSTEQTVMDDPDYGRWIRRASAATFRLAHANVYISEAVRASFAGAFPGRAGRGAPIISNGIDGVGIAAAAARSRAEVRAELGVAEGELAIVNVARLHPRKGQRFAIDALARLRAAEPRASLWLIGGGPEEAGLRAQAEALGLGGAVHLLGGRRGIPRLLGGFDAYLHPALVEGLGIAVLEAMAAGLPVVATAVGGVPEFVRDGETGLLAPPGDADALAARLASLLADGPARAGMAARGQALVLKEHDIRASVAAYEHLYLEGLEA